MIWKKSEANKVEIPARIKKLDTPSLLSWVDVTIMNFGASFDAWRFKDQSIDDVQEALDALVALWEEIKSRQV
jgi:hypothetical protein